MIDSPATVRHYGIAYGSGVVGNLRRRAWRFGDELRQQAWHALKRYDVIGRNPLERVAGHFRDSRIEGMLHDG